MLALINSTTSARSFLHPRRLELHEDQRFDRNDRTRRGSECRFEKILARLGRSEIHGDTVDLERNACPQSDQTTLVVLEGLVADEKIDGLGRTGMTVRPDREPADDDVTDPRPHQRVG